MLDMLINKAISQGQQLQKLSERVDRVTLGRKARAARPHFMKASYRVKQSDNTQQTLLFSNAGEPFEAHRLVMYPQVRLFSIDTSSTGETERVFRPAHWLSAGATSEQLRIAFDALVDIVFNGRKFSRPYQNAPFAGAQLLSSQPLVQRDGSGGNFETPFSVYETPSGMAFDEPYTLLQGESLGVGVTPIYTGKRDSNVDARIYEYEIVAILEGFKVLS